MKLKEKLKSFAEKAKPVLKKVGHILLTHPWSHCIAIGLVLNFIIECLHRHSLWEGILHAVQQPLPFLFNCLVITAVMSLCALFRRRYFLYCLFGALFLGFGIANSVLLSMRITPLEWADLQVVKISLITKYLSTFQIVLVAAVILLALAALVVLFIKFPKKKVNYLREAVSAAAFIVVLTVSLIVFRSTGILLSQHTKNIANAYKTYGFNYCFLCSVFDVGVDKPEVYTDEEITRIITEINSAAENNQTVKENAQKLQDGSASPNIIFLQLETFFDVNHLSNVEFSEDPLPTFTRLQNEYSSGYLSVPSIGAGTANTEFEIISGMSLDHFGMGEYPYKTILQTHPSESVSYNLSKYGYRTHAIHNNTATFYDRNLVFSNLGFDTYTSLEYMQNVELTSTGWAKDNVLVGCINDCLDSSEGSDMVYTITVQAHGKYPSEYEDEFTIEADGFSDDADINSEFTYYINQLHEVDAFVADLLDSLEARNERTVVVMYGDHLPSFEISESDLDGGDIFATEYVIWNNFGLQKQDGNIASYQLASHTMELLGLDNGILTKLHQNFSDRPEYLQWLQTLEYDMLYGEKYAFGGQENYPYETTELRMGVKDITISDVTVNSNGTATITGMYFTEHSNILINDEILDTIFIDNNTLVTEDAVEIKVGERLAVVQATKGGTALSSSKYYLLGGTEEQPTVTVDSDNIIYRPKGFKLSTAIAITVLGIALIASSATVVTVMKRRKKAAEAANAENELESELSK